MQIVSKYRVFISSPANVSDKRKLVASYVEKFSQRYIGTSNLEYEAFDMDNVPSDFGDSPQNIINEHLGSSDLYIGLMSSRFGTPTKEFGSGTEEEFHLALNKHKENNDFKVSFFFQKVTTPVDDLSQDEYDQIGKVRGFKDSMSGLGVYQPYQTDDDLETVVHAFLKNHASSVADKQFFQAELDLEIPEDQFLYNSEFFSNFVNSIGAEITNSRIASLKLRDVYVPMDLNPVRYSEDKQSEGNDQISSSSLFNVDELGSAFLLCGDEKAGKSTLCKTVLREQRSNNCVPIYIKGDKIKNASIDNFEKALEKCFEEQYSVELKEKYKLLPKSKILLIVDDFEEASLNAKHKVLFLAQLKNAYPNLLVTVDSNFLFNLNLAAADEFSKILDFKIFEFEDIGHKLRDTLIQKWVKLGREETISAEELFKQTEDYRRLIDGVIGANFVPKKPFIILVLLQAIQTGSSSNLQQGSFVRYYQYIIDSALLHGLSRNQVELSYAFMPIISYALFQSPKQKLSEAELSTLITEFADKKGIHKKELNDVKSSLIFLEMLVNDEGEYFFKHSYTYYFFLAQYLSDHIKDDVIKSQVNKICSELHLKENANIIVFLSYHSNDSLVIDNISTLVDSLFADTETFDFNTGTTSSLNQLVNSGPTVVLESRSEDYREEQLKHRDEMDKIVVKGNGDIDKQELDAMNYIARANLAHRSAEIIGHLLKNHPVRFDAEPKKQLYIKTVDVALRCLNELATFLANNQDVLIQVVGLRMEAQSKSKGKTNDPESDPQKEKKAIQKVVFSIAAHLVYGFVKNTAQFTGADTLSKTYEDVLKEKDSLAYRIVDLAIKMDFFTTFPIKELEKTASECEGNFLALSVVRNLVRNRLNMRPVDDYQLRHKICSIIGISVIDQLSMSKKVA